MDPLPFSVLPAHVIDRLTADDTMMTFDVDHDPTPDDDGLLPALPTGDDYTHRRPQRRRIVVTSGPITVRTIHTYIVNRRQP